MRSIKHDHEGQIRKNLNQTIDIPDHLLPKIQQYFGSKYAARTVINSSSRNGRLINLAILCDQYKHLGKSFVECGVAKGVCLAIMKVFSQDKSDVWGFDSFKGLPNLTKKDEGSGKEYEGHSCSGGIDNLYKHLKSKGISVDQKMHIVKGFFNDTFPQIDVGPISILRLDADWYEATLDCLNKFYSSVISGGVIIIDDYGSWKGCRNAVDEFRGIHNIRAPLIKTKGDWAEVFWFKH